MNPHGYRERYLARRLSRRQLLVRGSTAALGLVALGAAGCGPSEPAPKPSPSRVRVAPPAPAPTTSGGMSLWSRHALLANSAGLAEDPTVEEMEELLRSLREQHVTVVETDTKLSDWLNEDEFAAMLGMVTQWNRMCHGAGLKVVWYYPSLEVISPGGQYGPSFYKAYPEWAQLSIKGEPNYFFGGVVFWVEAGNESVWLSRNGPWREYYLARVKRIAATGADGIWPDVPIYFSGTAEWCDTSPWARAAFKADTGLEIPDGEDWTDPHWRRWIEWRHRNLNQFLLDIAAAGRSVNPEFETFVETVTCDYQDATRIGLDGAYLRLPDGITHVWEVDAISDSTAMRNAREDDYICQISMYKYCRAASGKKPAWAFDYGLQEDDAVQVMAEVLAAGCNPYEVKI